MTPLQPGPLSPGMIVSRSDIQCGEPCIAGTRVPARAIKDFHRAGYTIAQIHREYPGLTDEQLEAAIAFDGWITAPPGGWGSNPVGDRRIEIETADGTREIGCAADFDWTGEHLSINAFRLVDEATGESAEYRDAVRAANKLTDDEIWGSSAAPIPTEPVADRWADLERLAKAATPGPWRVAEDNNPFADGRHVFANGLDGSDFVVLNLKTDQTFVTATTRKQQQQNALFSAAANPSTVLELIAAARAKEAGE